MTIINLQYDLADVRDGFEPLPDGSYVCKITSVSLSQSSSGNPMIKFVWEVLDGEHAGRKLFDNVPLHVDWRVKAYANLIGITSGSEVDLDLFNGVEGILTVYTEAGSDGKTYNRIKTISPVA